MEICVLGASGFIGRNIVKYFGAVGITRRDLNLIDFSAVDVFFKNNLQIKFVIHCASVGGWRHTADPMDTVEQNIRTFMNVVEAAGPERKVIWFSSGAADATPTTRYGFSKYVIERLAAGYPNVDVLKIWGCWGADEPPTRFITTCLREKHVNIPEDKYFDFFHIDDVCKVVKYCIKSPQKQAFNLVYEEKLRLSDVARKIGVEYTVHSRGPDYVGQFNLDQELYKRMPLNKCIPNC